jgi:hypothetical protein
LSKPPVTATPETGFIRILEPETPPGRTLVSSLNARVLATMVQHIDNLLRDYPRGLPNGKGNRTKLTLTQRQEFKLALIVAVGHASVWASRGPLANRVKRRGRPPDNALFLFIDDIVRACKGVGLKPGLRYVAGSESLPVRLFIELAPLLWGPVKAPRRVFERWQRLRRTLSRG